MYAATIFKQFSKTFVLYRWISNAHAHEHNVLKGFFKAPFFIVKVFIFLEKFDSKVHIFYEGHENR